MKKLLLFIILFYSHAVFAQKDASYKKMEAEIKLEAKPAYIKANSEIEELREDVSLAKRNLLPKNSVVKKFNELVGRRMGREKTLQGVDKRLTKAGNAYVNFMFDMECARIAREKASESKFQAEMLKEKN